MTAPRWLSLLLFPFLLVLLIACAPVETTETDDQGITPIVPPTRVPPRPTSTATVAPTTAAAETPQPTPVSVSCQEAAPSAVSSRDSTPVASGTASTTQDEVNPRLVSPRSVEPPDPQLPIPSTTDLVLEGQLRLLLGENEAGYAIYALDLDSGRSVSINEDHVFYAASIFKAWVMYEVFHQESLGLFDMDAELVMTPYYDAFGLGPRATVLCQRLTVMEAMEAMMSVSDNAAAVLLQDLVGAWNINSSLEALGITASHLTTDELTVTAQDMGLLLQFIASGKAVDRESSELMASLMMSETFDNGLDAGVPAEASVAHKTGNWPDARHDIGIVFAPNSTYVIAILSDNREGSYGMIEAISAAIYESFNR